MPTDGLAEPHVTELIAFDRWAFGWLTGGLTPTEWLQQHLWQKGVVQWWEVVVSIVYFSHFLTLPTIAVVLWMRSRLQWARFMRRWLLVPDPAKQHDPDQQRVERTIAELPVAFVGDVRRWVMVLRGEGRRRHRAMSWINDHQVRWLRPPGPARLAERGRRTSRHHPRARHPGD